MAVIQGRLASPRLSFHPRFTSCGSVAHEGTKTAIKDSSSLIPIHFQRGGPLPNKGVSAESGGSFPTGGGELGGLIRQFDWSKTSLGPLAAWPQSLKTVTDTLLWSPVPIVLLWGEDGVMIYNDAYSVFAGGRHPQLLGSKVREGWPEVADFNDHVMKVGLSGGILSYRDQELTLFRHDRPEQVWMNLDYSPVLNEAGQPAGVIAIVVETTQRVIASLRRSIRSTTRRPPWMPR